MRWLLRKDLLILRRSRLTVALLVIYPVAIALLIGLALSRGPTKPRVAIVNETTPGADGRRSAARSVDVGEYAEQLFNQVEAVPAATRAQAVAKIQSGDVLAAVVIPHDIAARLSSDITQAHLEVLYNGDALEQSLVQSSLNSALAQANLGFSEQIQQAAAQAIGLLLEGRQPRRARSAAQPDRAQPDPTAAAGRDRPPAPRPGPRGAGTDARLRHLRRPEPRPSQRPCSRRSASRSQSTARCSTAAARR